MAESLQEKREARRQRKQETAVAEADTDIDKSMTEKKGVATPSRRKGEKTEGSGNAITRPIRRTVEYFQGVRSEIEKVTWPDREETNRLTRIVLVVTLASALFLGGLSILFTEIFNIGVEQPWVFMLVFVGFLVAMFGYARFTSRGDTLDY